MGFKKSIERATIDKWKFQKRCCRIKDSWDEVERMLGTGKKCGHRKKK